MSVTFVLFSILLLKLAYSFKNKKYLYLSLLSLFGAVFSKETAGYLFLLLPILVFIEERVRRNRTFSLRFLSKLFVFCLILYVVIRFVIPGIGNLLSGANKIRAKAVDTGTIVSRDLSIHKNLPLEIVFRTITYPIRMTGTVFVPRDTVVFMVEALAPIVRPTPSGGDRTGQVEFILGSGPYTVIYLFSIGMLIYIFLKIKDSLLSKKYQESAALVFGIGTIFLASLPLVVIIFAFPRWGYDSYFDGRHYYHPTIGAAIIFPFLLEDTSRFISKIFKSRVKASATFVGLFLLWLINNMFIFNYNFGQIVNKYNGDRREVLVQLKKHLPVLPKKVAFYFETDGNSIYGPILPFQTSVPQAISVYYYKTSPLPNSFFENTILNGKAEGYQVAQGQGFGYYMNKDKLAEDLSRGEFQVSNIYAYHYKAGEVRLLDISQKIRSEMADYLVEAEKTKDWKLFKDKIQVFSFLYPPEAIINQEDNTMTINITHPSFSLNLFVTIVSPGFNANEYLQITSKGNLGIVNSKKVSYDKFHSKDAVAISENGQIEYLIQLTDKLIVGETDQKDNTFVEKILGSIVILTK
ncbi:MAG: hypothetical protein HY427_00045 [Candidatus Levybacteria bacterium]|nr:hypothetical protein [Candidatus Levybacteria bacterium]